jgi:hypothetical protein
MTGELSPAAMTALRALDETWRMAPACFEPSPVLEALELLGFAQTERRRHGTPSVYRWFVRRTPTGTRAAGIEGAGA